jgi:hypothetical protein
MKQFILTILIVVSIYLFVQPVSKRLRLVAKGRQGFHLDRIAKRVLRFLKEVVFQWKIIKERPLAGFMHGLVFWGFVFFLLETIHHFSTAYGWHPLGEGTFHRIYGAIVAFYAVLVIIGITALTFRRFILRPITLGKLSLGSAAVALFI